MSTDITRNWRLHNARSKLIATRCPETGVVMLPQQTSSAVRSKTEGYTFEPIKQGVVDTNREGGNGHKPEVSPLVEGYAETATHGKERV